MTTRFFYRAAERITPLPCAEAPGGPRFELLRGEVCASACWPEQTMPGGETGEDMPVSIVRAANRRVPIRVTTTVMKDKAGNVAGAFGDAKHDKTGRFTPFRPRDGRRG